MKKIWFILIFVTLLLQTGFSQPLFNSEGVTLIEITFEESNWDEILDDYYAADNNERLLAEIAINGVSFDSVGIRYRGGATYDPDQGKNPFNIKLDFVKNHDYEGTETLKLNNGAKDPSFVREILTFEIANQYMPAPQANFAKVYVNGIYFGMYVNVENVDKSFLAERFNSDRDNTFFTASPSNNPQPVGCTEGIGASLEYLGTAAECYFDDYNLESDVPASWDELIPMIGDVNQNFGSAFIETSLNIDRAIWMCAMNNLLVNLDSYLGAEPTNYYLFRDDNDRFNMVVWDMNESFGGDRKLIDGADDLTIAEMQNLDPLLRTDDETRPLLKLILGNPIYKRQYMAHYRTIFQEVVSNGWYATRAQELINMINLDIESDPNKLYSFAEFNSNLNATIPIEFNGSMIDIPGLTQLMNGRSTFLLGHPEFAKTPPTISNISHAPLDVDPNTTISITAEIENASYVYLGYRDNFTQVFQKEQMFDDGNHDDGAAGDGIYGVSILVGAEGVEYYIYAEDSSEDVGVFSPERAEEEFYNITTFGDVVINELMASNATTQADQDNEFDDWVELYNNTNAPINLNGYYLTDNANNLMKYQFPNVTIDGGGYLIIWTDSDPEQEGLHTDFKLSGSGEELLLVNSNLQVVDKVVFGAQTTDVSYARIPNGIGSFAFDETPSFNADNGLADATIDLAEELGLKIYPNPTDGFLIFDLEIQEPLAVTLYNTFGQAVRELELFGKMEVDISDLNNGMYWLGTRGQVLGKIVVAK